MSGETYYVGGGAWQVTESWPAPTPLVDDPDAFMHPASGERLYIGDLNEIAEQPLQPIAGDEWLEVRDGLWIGRKAWPDGDRSVWAVMIRRTDGDDDGPSLSG